jgi:hypothetical protein
VTETAHTQRFRRAIEEFDRANVDDPNFERVSGTLQAKELVYSQRMTATLDEFEPTAPEVVRLAARCQHIRRWTVPRSTYPEGRDGYRRWRSDLAQFHAETAADILTGVGYDADTVQRVQVLLRKERLKVDAEVQLLEDVACLVFLTYYLPAFVEQHEELKVIEVLRKTWRKMSTRGQSVALELDLPDDLRSLVGSAIAPVE